jgi:hypothetical protein
MPMIRDVAPRLRGSKGDRLGSGLGENVAGQGSVARLTGLMPNALTERERSGHAQVAPGGSSRLT